ncbi:uncharacterized protein LOC128385852 [Panonychus citri]|uniref:uncharacterized protein LOC128385852 n=1 Tax=Panonychus citri TaxID=50023 RepID=UPI002307C68B|nr:uncharacterized protein LOC128385852 [Panonychus citri]
MGGQLFFLDTEQANAIRMQHPANSTLQPLILETIHSYLANHNPYALRYRHLNEVRINFARMQGKNLDDFGFEFFNREYGDLRTENIPSSFDIAAVFETTDGTPPNNRSLRVYPKSTNGCNHVPYLSPHLDPMAYPLLWPHGESGWQSCILHNPSRATSIRNKVTVREFNCSRLFERSDWFNAVVHSGKLTQQVIVDYYCRHESSRLDWIRRNQDKLRVETYAGLCDVINSRAETEGIRAGVMKILPSSFSGSPRNMLHRYQDAMAIVRHFGKPDYFITMTCNPKWPEISLSMAANEKPEDRPDIVVRVFAGKVEELKNLIMKKKIFGPVVSLIHVIEFQKRGLPHVHMLLKVHHDYTPRQPDIIDKVVCAEIPCANQDPLLYSLVSSHMIHGPCGQFNMNSPCMKDNKCLKNFPKSFQESTNTDDSGFPLYRRRNNGRSVLLRNGTIEANNSFVVPYNVFLLKYFRCHINVEICCTVQATKYLHKYLFKGYDQSNFQVTQNGDRVDYDEIANFLKSRYVGSTEAAYRLFALPLHYNSHAVEDLPVHLPHQNFVTFSEDNALDVAASYAVKKTKLTAWFEANSQEDTQTFYYEMPIFYSFDRPTKMWKKRQRNCKTIGRLQFVSPRQQERYALRLLLLRVASAKSFEDLRTFEGNTYPTFMEAARARGLVDDDSEWYRCLNEMSHFAFAPQLRETFTYILVFSCPSNANALFEKFYTVLSEDFRRNFSENIARNKTLIAIQNLLDVHQKNLNDFGLPPVESERVIYPQFTEPERRIAIINSERISSMANSEQRLIIDYIKSVVFDVHTCDRIIFIDGAGGTGKTFIYNCLIDWMIGLNETVIPVAWTGMAATLLKGGRTSHSRFGLPLNFTETSVSKIAVQSKEADLLRKAKLFIWDEASMIPGRALSVVDSLLRDITGIQLPFGGKTFVFGGDFRQILPVVVNGGKAETINNCIKKSILWQHFKVMKLTNNMRAAESSQAFRDLILSIGDGTYPNQYGVVLLPPSIVLPQTSDIVQEVFGSDVNELLSNPDRFSSRSILCPKNIHCDDINHRILGMLSGESKTYLSLNTIEDSDDNSNFNYPTEFLDNLQISGLPPHKLELKKGAIVMLLRNLNLDNGLTNGTRLSVIEMFERSLKLRILTGANTGNIVFLPKINLIPSDTRLPFSFKRKQFPIKLAFAVTINKAQGQTLSKVGIYLPSPVFSHGQLYVAMSRVSGETNLKIKIDNLTRSQTINNITKNIVYKEVLTD